MHIREAFTRKRVRITYLAVAIVGVFVLCAWDGLFVGFDQDDLMNLHEAWKIPMREFLPSLLMPFTAAYRPSGSAYYRICFAVFGWWPVAFRFVTYLLLAWNILLVGSLGRRLSGARLTGVVAAVLFTFHGGLWQIYKSNGTVYDVLCTFFTLLALNYYVRIRMKRAVFRIREILAMLALFVAALNAKEMAAMLPFLLICFEWIYMPSAAGSGCQRTREGFRNCRFAVVLLCISIVSVWAKTRAAAFNNPAYAVSFRPERLLQNVKSLYSEIFYVNEAALEHWPRIVFFVCLAGALLLALRARKKALRFAACFALLTPLPVLLVPYRGFFVMYLPLAGWAIGLATLIVWVRDAVVARTARLQVAASLSAVTLALAALFYGRIEAQPRLSVISPWPGIIQGMRDDFLRLNEPLPEGANLLLLQSRYPDDAWGPLMTAQLLYADRNLWLDRPAMMTAPVDSATFEQYDRVITFANRRLAVLVRRRDSGRRPLFRPDAGPRFFEDF